MGLPSSETSENAVEEDTDDAIEEDHDDAIEDATEDAEGELGGVGGRLLAEVLK